MSKKLTPKQDRFCREYVIDLNGTQAAIRAGYSPRTADRLAYENLRKPEIQSRVSELAKKVDEKAEVNGERILRELLLMAHFDPSDVANKCSSPAEIALLPEHVRRAIAGWSWDKHGNFILKFHDKLRALELLGKHRALWTERHEHKHSGDMTFNMVLQTEPPTKETK